jgi:hypothetical protein
MNVDLGAGLVALALLALGIVISMGTQKGPAEAGPSSTEPKAARQTYAH